VFIVSGLKIVTMWDNRANVFALFVQSNSQSAVFLVKVSHTLLHTKNIVV